MRDQVFFIVLCMPLAWSLLVAGTRRLAHTATPDDATEKYQLLIMVTPILIGAVWLIASPWLHAYKPLPAMTAEVQGALAPHVPGERTLKHTVHRTAWLVPSVLGLWAAVAMVRLASVGLALYRLGRVKAKAAPQDVDGVRVHVTSAAVPPLAWGRRAIVVPARLIALMTTPDLGMVIRHEQAHLDRRDPLYFAALGLTDAVLWFNPFIRAQTARCRLAAEFACDAAAAGKNPEERETYARVLIKALKHTAGDVRQYAPAVISNVKSGDYRMRLREIMHADPSARKPKPKWLYGLLAAALIPVAVAQFAWAQGDVTAATNVKLTVMPIDAPISSPFGTRTDPLTLKPAFHQGVDFTVPSGTPVHAPADGKVVRVEEQPGMGLVVQLIHKGGLATRYAHLDKAQVAVGDHVKAGDVIATSGNSGKGTGPHLHFEVWRDGKPVDPATMLPAKAGQG